jgi:rod shape-determining protein MreC
MRSPSARAEVSPVNPRRGFAVLIVVLAACVLMMSAQAPARGGRGTVLRSWLLTGSAPLTAAAGAVSRGVSGAIDHTAELFTARTDNERLRRELEASQRELFVLRSRAQQADEARRLEEAGAALPNVLGSVPLLLVERRSGTYSAIVGAGSEQGVVPGSPLAVPAGLVGRVVTVGRGVSRAQFLLDASAAAGARVARTGELGVIRGDGRGSLLLNNIGLASTIQRGDLIESAGIDGIYPRGVTIGRVAEVTRGGKLFLEIRVAPAADFSRLTDVLLLSPSPAVREMPEPGQGARVERDARLAAAERDARLAAATAAPSPPAVTPHSATPPAAAPRTAAATEAAAAPAAPTPVVTTPAPRPEAVTPRPSRTAAAREETVRPTPTLYPPLLTPTNSTSDAPQ